METFILVILSILPGVWSGDWGVTFSDQCAIRGTSVLIECKYDYPFPNIVTSALWYKVGQLGLIPLSSISSVPGHFRYLGNKRGDCGLEINNVQPSDVGAYYFQFETTLNRWKSRRPAYLTVTELTAVVQPRTVTEGDNVRLTCVSTCLKRVNVVWFRDGHPVSGPVFQAKREDAGRYYCAVLGQERLRSASVVLNVHYAPRKVSLSVSPSAVVVKGSSVTLTCSSDANPPVTQSGYSLFKDGHFISSGPFHNISDIQPSHSGLYSCHAWNNISRRGIELFNSTELHLDVQYGPMNMSVLMDPPQVTEGSSVNMTCSSSANPAAENYTWYKRIESPSSSLLLQVGSGWVLSLPSVEASHTGLYLCQAGNTVGENTSTEVLLSMTAQKQGSLPSVLGGVGLFLLVMLVFALLLFWRKQKTQAEKKQSAFDIGLSGRSSSSLAADDPSDCVYANIGALPSSPPPVAAQGVTPSQRKSRQDEGDVTYSTVTIKPRNPGPSRHRNNSRDIKDSWSTARETDDSVIYATVEKPSRV